MADPSRSLTVPPVLQVEGLSTEIRRRTGALKVLDDVSFEVAPAETFAIVGESGSGKSITALSIMRLLPPSGHVTGGRILLDGTDVLRLSTTEMAAVRGDRVAMVFQDPLSSLNPTMTVGAQVAEALRLHRPVSRREAWERSVEALGLVGVPDAPRRAQDFPHQFSGGMRQRVAIAMALVCEPAVLIADEPTTALDVTTQRQILDLFALLQSRFSMAIIFISHDLNLVAGRADRIAVMYAGQIVEEAPADTLFAHPRHRYTEALLDSSPRGSRSSGRLLNIKGRPPGLARVPTGCRFAPRCLHTTPGCTTAAPELRQESPAHSFRCVHPSKETRSVPILELGSPAPAPKSEPIVFECDHIVKDFRTAQGVLQLRGRGRISAVADVSMAVRAGETFGLVGESGCGKSTLARIMVALDQPTSGEVRLRGKDLAVLPGKELRLARRSLQLVFQDAGAALNPRMSVGSILSEPLRIQRIGSRRDRAASVRSLLDEVGLPAEATDRYPHEFSGGQRQRIALARALALRPSVVVADEPVSALDVSVQAQILNLMADLQRAHDLAYVFVSHDLSVVRYLADRIGVMYLGKLVEVGPSESVYRNPRHPYTRALLDASPGAPTSSRDGDDDPAVQGEIPSASHPPSGCRFRTRCPRAQVRCAEVEPALEGDPHLVACHFPLNVVTTTDRAATDRAAAAGPE